MIKGLKAGCRAPRTARPAFDILTNLPASYVARPIRPEMILQGTIPQGLIRPGRPHDRPPTGSDAPAMASSADLPKLPRQNTAKACGVMLYAMSSVSERVDQLAFLLSKLSGHIAGSEYD